MAGQEEVAKQAEEVIGSLSNTVGGLNVSVRYETDNESYIRVYIQSDCRAGCTEQDCCSPLLSSLKEGLRELEEGNFSAGAVVGLDPNMAKMVVRSFKLIHLKQLGPNRAELAFEIGSTRMGIRVLTAMYDCMSKGKPEEVADCLVSTFMK
jgi:hypothetical protein